jgi:hypothetical protein
MDDAGLRQELWTACLDREGGDQDAALDRFARLRQMSAEQQDSWLTSWDREPDAAPRGKREDDLIADLRSNRPDAEQEIYGVVECSVGELRLCRPGGLLNYIGRSRAFAELPGSRVVQLAAGVNGIGYVLTPEA